MITWLESVGRVQTKDDRCSVMSTLSPGTILFIMTPANSGCFLLLRRCPRGCNYRPVSISFFATLWLMLPIEVDLPFITNPSGEFF